MIEPQEPLSPDQIDQMPALVDMMTTKRCGSCHLCCTALQVFELEKPIGVRCDHLNECGKCQIYEQRPPSCKTFYCTWRLQEVLKVKLPWDMKPERCGFVLHWDRHNSPLCTLFPDPKRPHAWLSYKRKLEQFAKQYDCAIVIGGGEFATHMVFPSGRWVARADWPLYFSAKEVGIPASEFRHSYRWKQHPDPYKT